MTSDKYPPVRVVDELMDSSKYPYITSEYEKYKPYFREIIEKYYRECISTSPDEICNKLLINNIKEKIFKYMIYQPEEEEYCNSCDSQFDPDRRYFNIRMFYTDKLGINKRLFDD